MISSPEHVELPRKPTPPPPFERINPQVRTEKKGDRKKKEAAEEKRDDEDHATGAAGPHSKKSPQPPGKNPSRGKRLDLLV